MNKTFSYFTLSCIVMLALFMAVSFSAPSFARANSCQAKAARLAAAKGGSVLSVRSQGNKCKIKLLIQSPKGPPKSKVFVVRK